MPAIDKTWLSQSVPLPHVLLLLALGTGGSGAVGMLTRNGDLSTVQPLIDQAVAEAVAEAVGKSHAEDQAQAAALLQAIGALKSQNEALQYQLNRVEIRVDTLITRK